MSFSFGFSGDDVGDDNDVVAQNDGAPAQAEAKSQFVGLPAEEHSLNDLVGSHIILYFRGFIVYGLSTQRSLCSSRAEDGFLFLLP